MNTDDVIAAVNVATHVVVLLTIVVCGATLAVTFDLSVVAAVKVLLDL